MIQTPSFRYSNNIFRTNMQSAYNAGRYQAHMDNIDNRPYWQYDAVGDERTRAAHAAMDGLVYRYDDPFWQTFYPPNGYRCRCSVIALSERDMERHNKDLRVSNDDNLIEIQKIYNKKGESYPTMAYKSPDGRLHTTDRGFNYNVGRMNYRPNLDLYDRGLAHEFAKAEMRGAEFQAAFRQLSDEFGAVKARLGVEDKPNAKQVIQIRNVLSRQLKFAAGVLTPETQKLTGIPKATVWLSDDTLIKQIDSREGQGFGLEKYSIIPEIIKNPDLVFHENKKKVYLIKEINERWYLTVNKYLSTQNEIFLESFRETNLEEISRFKYEQLK